MLEHTLLVIRLPRCSWLLPPVKSKNSKLCSYFLLYIWCYVPSRNVRTQRNASTGTHKPVTPASHSFSSSTKYFPCTYFRYLPSLFSPSNLSQFDQDIHITLLLSMWESAGILLAKRLQTLLSLHLNFSPYILHTIEWSHKS